MSSNDLVKGRTNNHISWGMVDATDFATPESALSAATKIKIWGKLRGAVGVNFVTSGTGSLVNDIQHIGPSVLGLYTIALVKADLSDASAAWYDQYAVVLSATGAAQQVLILDGGIDASAILAAAVQGNSRVLVVQSQASDAYSAIIAPLASMTSDIASAVWAHAVGAQVNSRLLVAQSFLSDIRSNVSDLQSVMTVTGVQLNASSLSDLRSAITAGPAGVLTVSDISDIASRVWADTLGAAVSSRVLLAKSSLSDIISFLSDLGSDFQSRVPKRVATDSQLSDMASDLRSYLVGMSGMLSDVQSAVAAGGTVTVSNISDIASAVDAILASRLSDILSAAVQANSRILVTQSMTSDLQSKLSDVESNLLSFLATTGVQLNTSVMSDLRSAITGVTATLSASDLSDIRSAITAAQSDLRSLISTAGPTISDMASAFWNEKYHANSAASTFGSLFSVMATNAAAGSSRALLNQSRISDVQSYLVALSGLVSDIQSAVAIGNSRALVNQSFLSDIDSALTSRFSDMHSFLSTTGVQLNPSVMSDIRSAVNAVTVNLTASDISDIASAVLAGAGATVLSASDMSDIASRVWAMAPATALTSRMLVALSAASDAASAAQQANSRVLALQSMASDIDSALTSRFSDLHSFLSTTGVQINPSSLSDIRSAITAGGGAATISASDISDIASAVWANTIGARVDSRVLVNKSMISDVQSMVSDLQSDFQSRVPKLVANNSQLSDLASDITSKMLVAQSTLSDIQSAVAVIPATKLAAHAETVLLVVVGTGSTTTTMKLSTVEGGAPSSVNDFYNGRVIIFRTGTLTRQAVSITDYDGATTTATISAATGSAVNGDTAVMV